MNATGLSSIKVSLRLAIRHILEACTPQLELRDLKAYRFSVCFVSPSRLLMMNNNSVVVISHHMLQLGFTIIRQLKLVLSLFLCICSCSLPSIGHPASLFGSHKSFTLGKI